ncbi:MAG TPA: putative DNA modification/repair radical SAM protein [bacterium]|nr:putative DNA modification/repair radical SAM protein [bacterium]HPS30061.1 putative DNA modification/repair radical SAM protein [bacterium]
MDVMKKLEILSDSAKYDASCASSGSFRKTPKGGIGNGKACGICHSWADDGRCISLFKVLFTNSCIYDCAYCINRRSNDIQRVIFTPREIADITIEFYRRNYIEGLFLSSGIIKNPDYTMELLSDALRILRHEYRFGGYIHVKAIPGASKELIDKAGALADRISVNIELPTKESLHRLTDKKHTDIFQPMKLITEGVTNSIEERKISRFAPKFAPAGQSTQMIVGATPETDLTIVKLSEAMYNKFNLRRVYYSAFIPVNNDSRLPVLREPPLLREHRLYQADFLMRQYQFHADEILSPEHPMLDTALDPKANWALNHFSMFPVEVNNADYEMLLRVPGIGPRSAKRIVIARRSHYLNFDNLKSLGVVLKRARYFITCKGVRMPAVSEKLQTIYRSLVESHEPGPFQLKLFSTEPL